MKPSALAKVLSQVTAMPVGMNIAGPGGMNSRMFNNASYAIECWEFYGSYMGDLAHQTSSSPYYKLPAVYICSDASPGIPDAYNTNGQYGLVGTLMVVTQAPAWPSTYTPSGGMPAAPVIQPGDTLVSQPYILTGTKVLSQLPINTNGFTGETVGGIGRYRVDTPQALGSQNVPTVAITAMPLNWSNNQNLLTVAANGAGVGTPATSAQLPIFRAYLTSSPANATTGHGLYPSTVDNPYVMLNPNQLKLSVGTFSSPAGNLGWVGGMTSRVFQYAAETTTTGDIDLFYQGLSMTNTPATLERMVAVVTQVNGLVATLNVAAPGTFNNYTGIIHNTQTSQTAATITSVTKTGSMVQGSKNLTFAAGTVMPAVGDWIEFPCAVVTGISGNDVTISSSIWRYATGQSVTVSNLTQSTSGTVTTNPGSKTLVGLKTSMPSVAVGDVLSIPNSANGNYALIKCALPSLSSTSTPLQDYQYYHTGNGGTLWDQGYMAMMKAMNVRNIRTMDAMVASNNTSSVWADRAVPWMPSLYTPQASGNTIPLELMADLANKLDSSLWVNWPLSANNDYFQKGATILNTYLDPWRTVRNELGNETWNTGRAWVNGWNIINYMLSPYYHATVVDKVNGILYLPGHNFTSGEPVQGVISPLNRSAAFDNGYEQGSYRNNWYTVHVLDQDHISLHNNTYVTSLGTDPTYASSSRIVPTSSDNSGYITTLEAHFVRRYDTSGIMPVTNYAGTTNVTGTPMNICAFYGYASGGVLTVTSTYAGQMLQSGWWLRGLGVPDKTNDLKVNGLSDPIIKIGTQVTPLQGGEVAGGAGRYTLVSTDGSVNASTLQIGNPAVNGAVPLQASIDGGQLQFGTGVQLYTGDQHTNFGMRLGKLFDTVTPILGAGRTLNVVTTQLGGPTSVTPFRVGGCRRYQGMVWGSLNTSGVLSVYGVGGKPFLASASPSSPVPMSSLYGITAAGNASAQLFVPADTILTGALNDGTVPGKPGNYQLVSPSGGSFTAQTGWLQVSQPGLASEVAGAPYFNGDMWQASANFGSGQVVPMGMANYAGRAIWFAVCRTTDNPLVLQIIDAAQNGTVYPSIIDACMTTSTSDTLGNALLSDCRYTVTGNTTAGSNQFVVTAIGSTLGTQVVGGQVITGSGIPMGTLVQSQNALTGSDVAGGIGTYVMSQPATTSSTGITLTLAYTPLTGLTDGQTYRLHAVMGATTSGATYSHAYIDFVSGAGSTTSVTSKVGAVFQATLSNLSGAAGTKLVVSSVQQGTILTAATDPDGLGMFAQGSALVGANRIVSQDTPNVGAGETLGGKGTYNVTFPLAIVTSRTCYGVREKAHAQCDYLAFTGSIPSYNYTGSISGSTLSITAVSTGSYLVAGSQLSGTSMTACRIVKQLTGTPNGVGTYQVDVSQTWPSGGGTGTIAAVGRLLRVASAQQQYYTLKPRSAIYQGSTLVGTALAQFTDANSNVTFYMDTDLTLTGAMTVSSRWNFFDNFDDQVYRSNRGSDGIDASNTTTAVYQQKVVANLPLVAYECGWDWSTATNFFAPWLNAFIASKQSGQSVRYHFEKAATSGITVFNQYGDNATTVFTLTDGYNPNYWQNDGRALAFQNMHGYLLRRPTAAIPATNLGADVSQPSGYPSTIYTFPDSSLSYSLIDEDDKRQYQFNGNQLQIITGIDIGGRTVDYTVAVPRQLRVIARNADGSQERIFTQQFSVGTVPMMPNANAVAAPAGLVALAAPLVSLDFADTTKVTTSVAADGSTNVVSITGSDSTTFNFATNTVGTIKYIQRGGKWCAASDALENNATAANSQNFTNATGSTGSVMVCDRSLATSYYQPLTLVMVYEPRRLTGQTPSGVYETLFGIGDPGSAGPYQFQLQHAPGKGTVPYYLGLTNPTNFSSTTASGGTPEPLVTENGKAGLRPGLKLAVMVLEMNTSTTPNQCRTVLYMNGGTLVYTGPWVAANTWSAGGNGASIMTLFGQRSRVFPYNYFPNHPAAMNLWRFMIFPMQATGAQVQSIILPWAKSNYNLQEWTS